MPTKRSNNNRPSRRRSTGGARNNASQGFRTSNLGGNRGSSRGSSRASYSGRGRHTTPTTPSLGNRVSNLLDSATDSANQLIGAARSRFGKDPAQGGFSTSFNQSSQKGTLPSFGQPGGFGQGNLNPKDNKPGSSMPEVVLTRRNLVIGAAAVGGVVAIGGVGSAVMDALDGDKKTVEYISVPEEAVMGVDDLKEVKVSKYTSLQVSSHQPYGTLAFADNDSYACLLVPGEDASPLNIVKCMSLSSGNTSTLLKKAKGAKDGFEIVDARLSTKGLVWIESNIYENTWRVYTATFGGDSIGDEKLVEEGDANWLTPSIAAVDNRAFWQLIPNSEGENASDPSVVRSAKFGSKKASDLITSKRAFATRITPVEGGVVCTPRADSTGTYYQLTLLDSKKGEITDQMTLPASMNPDQASWGKSGFNFAFTNTYNYGEGIAKLGTYTPTSAVDPYNYQNLSSWFRFGRTPSAPPCWCGEWYCIKSTRAISGIHFAKKKYFSISPVSDVESWGEYLVSTGNSKYIVGLSKVTPSNGDDPYSLIRVFTTSSGKLGSSLK